MPAYTPNPIDTSHIKLPRSIDALTELLAKNTHEIWAHQRLRDGWQFGPVRDDAQKQHPCLVPYEQLPESEKDYDRATALQTLKLLIALGYRIEKANGNDLIKS